MVEYVYIGREPCGCVTFVTADSPEHARVVDRDLAYCVRRGLTINRIPIEAFRAMPVGCSHKRAQQQQQRLAL